MTGAPPVRGSVFGFDIHSSFVFETLHPAAGLPPLTVAATESEPAEEGELLAEIVEPGFRARISRESAEFRLWVENIGCFRIDPARAYVEAPAAVDPFVREELVLGVPALLCFHERGDTSLHAAAIDLGGQAALFVAPPRHGKSTLAAAFSERGFHVLTEDLACIRMDGTPVVLPGPASIRLRHDVAGEVAPSLERRRAGGERTRYAPKSSAEGGKENVPIAMVILLRASEGDVQIEEVSPVRALPDLWQASFRLTRQHEVRAFSALGQLVETVPIKRLSRPLTVAALDRTIEAVLAATQEPHQLFRARTAVP
jgi:hypothetical protein